MRLLNVLFLLALFSFVKVNSAERLLQPYNLNFEIGVSHSMPKGWFMSMKHEQMGFQAGINSKDALKNNYCLQLNFLGELKEKLDGSVYQSIDAKDYRGKAVKFRVAINTENITDTALCKVWIGEHFITDRDAVYHSSDSITTADGWKYFEISGKIDKETDLINFGVTLHGDGYVLIDDASFEFTEKFSESIVIDDRSLARQELENEIAFTRLLGHVRYFYPGFEASDANWELFTLTGVESVESAQNRNELVETLKRLFLPVAPGIEFLNDKTQKSKRVTMPDNALENIALAWLHIGADLGIPINYFSSDLRNIYIPTRNREAPVIQIIDALPFRGMKIRFSAFAKADVYQPDGQAQLWLGIDNGENKVVLMKTTADEPIKANRWKKYNVEAEVPADATVLRLALVMFGDGKVWFDNPELKILAKGKQSPKNHIRNEGFEEGKQGNLISGWKFPESALKAGYETITTDKIKYKGKRSLQISSDESTRIEMPKINETVSLELVPGITAVIPLTLYMDSASTLPEPPKDIKPVQPFKPESFVMTGNDRYSRLATTAILWNVFRHFGIGIDSDTNWDSILNKALSKAATDGNDNELLMTLNRMITEINDGQGKVWINEKETVYGIPLLWKLIDNKLIIVKAMEDYNEIIPGSEVLAINGKTVNELLFNEKIMISGKTEQWRNLRVTAELRAGNLNDTVNLKVITPAGAVEEHILLRNTQLFDLTEKRPPKFYIIQEHLYYMDLTRITDRGMKNIVNDLKEKLLDAKAIVFDLRGFTSLSEEFLGMFLNNEVKSVIRKYPVFSKPGGSPCTFFKLAGKITARNPHVKASLVFLIDERTSGGAEILAGLAKYYKLGVLTGTKTSGTVNEVFGINLPGEYNASMV
ncbi:S41 family peptidase, partial [Bacteroidota bacterium]